MSVKKVNPGFPAPAGHFGAEFLAWVRLLKG
jgi:hypothetical protein